MLLLLLLMALSCPLQAEFVDVIDYFDLIVKPEYEWYGYGIKFINFHAEVIFCLCVRTCRNSALQKLQN